MKLLKLYMMMLMTAGLLMAQSADEAVNLLENQDGFGVRAAAMGNAYTGVADDYSAIYWNPAGLAQIRSNELSITLSHLKNNSDVTYLGKLTEDSRAFTKLDNFGLVYPFAVTRGSLVMAMGYQRVKNLDSYLNFGGNLTEGTSNGFPYQIYDDDPIYFDSGLSQQRALTTEGSLSQWSFGMAIDLSPNFSGGFSLNLLSGDSDYKSTYSQDDLNGRNEYTYEENGVPVEDVRFAYYDITQKIENEFAGFEAKLGGMFKVNDNIRLGGTITFPATIRITENWSMNDDLAFDIYTYSTDITEYYSDVYEDAGTFDYDIKIPFRFSGGLSYENSIFLFAANAEYTDWSQLRYEKPDDRDMEDYEALLEQNDYFAEDFQAVLSWGVGAEVKLFKDALMLRGGYRTVPSPYKDSTLGIEKDYYTAGVGMKLDESTVLEASYVYGNYTTNGYYYYEWDDYSEIDPMTTSEEITSQKLLVGIKFSF